VQDTEGRRGGEIFKVAARGVTHVPARRESTRRCSLVSGVGISQFTKGARECGTLEDAGGELHRVPLLSESGRRACRTCQAQLGAGPPTPFGIHVVSKAPAYVLCAQAVRVANMGPAQL
jgi:hypothetical protein